MTTRQIVGRQFRRCVASQTFAAEQRVPVVGSANNSEWASRRFERVGIGHGFVMVSAVETPEGAR